MYVRSLAAAQKIVVVSRDYGNVLERIKKIRKTNPSTTDYPVTRSHTLLVAGHVRRYYDITVGGGGGGGTRRG